MSSVHSCIREKERRESEEKRRGDIILKCVFDRELVGQDLCGDFYLSDCCLCRRYRQSLKQELSY